MSSSQSSKTSLPAPSRSMPSILRAERTKSSIDPLELAHTLYRGKQHYDLAQSYIKAVSKAAGPNKPKIFEMGRTEAYGYAVEQWSKIRKGVDVGFIERDDPVMELFYLTNYQSPGSVGAYMSVQNIRVMGDDEQVKMWVPKILNHVYFCNYAQTELSAGNDVQNLQTLAVFDPKTQEFEIHSPTVESVKWWPGDLGMASTHSVVMARLLSNGKDYGIQPFFIEIRDPKTHIPHKGVEIGDIGPKLGYTTKDNGFMRFTRYRVPRISLLSRYIKVDSEGIVTKHGNPKRMYAGMLLMRSTIAVASYTDLLKACTIATRYSLYRTQFKDSNKQFIPIYDYQIQRDKLFREISRAYLMAFATQEMFAQLALNNSLAQKDDYSELQNTHVSLCCLKATFSLWTFQGLSNLIKACGGHGFSMFSGIPSIMVENFPHQIVEGENTVLLLQVSRHLLKLLSWAKKGEIESKINVKGQFGFMAQFDDWTEWKKESEDLDVTDYAKIFTKAVCVLLERAGMKMFGLVQEKKDPKLIWDKLVGNDILKLAKVYSVQLSLSSAWKHISNLRDGPIKQAVQRLYEFSCISIVEEFALPLLETDSLTSEQASQTSARKDQLLEELKDDGLVLAEGMQFSDDFLGSAIGSQDKDPYETLYKWAKQYGQMNQFLDQTHPKIREYQLRDAHENSQKL